MKTDLSKILSVGGQPGLHRYLTQSSGGVVVESLSDGKRKWKCIHMEENLVAGYPHLYYPSCKEFAERFVEKCRSGYRE